MMRSHLWTAVCATFYLLILFTALLSPYLWKENSLDPGQAFAFERMQTLTVTSKGGV
jgi:hypothetical protein